MYNTCIDTEIGNQMNITLITTTGKVYTFFVMALAIQYQQAYGGTIVTGQVLAQPVTL
jgi:hypothetical protein